MAPGTAAKHLTFWIAFGLICLGSCSVYLLKPNSHGLTPLARIVGEDNTKGLNLPEEFLQLSRRKRRSPESSDTLPDWVTEFEFKNDGDYVGFIHWPGESEVVFFFTCGEANRTIDGQFYCKSVKLWRSTDYGGSFEYENKKFGGNVISGMEFCAQDNNKVIASSIKNKTLFVSSNKGETYKQHGIDFKPYAVSCNPGTNSNILVACDLETKKLYASDGRAMPVFGTALSKNVNKFFWDLKVTDDPAIYLEVKMDNDLYLSVLKRVVLKSGVKPDDVQPFISSLGNFTTDSLQIEGNYIFVKKHLKSIGLFVYSMLNSTFFQRAIFPSDMSEKDYVIVDASENEVLVAVRHQKADPILNDIVANLYISGISGSKYVLSLENVFTVATTRYNQKMNVIDIHRVQSSEGIYMANVVLGGRVRSVITFNKGGEWHPITAPQVDQHGHPLNCEAPDCSLHIHMAVSKTFRYISEVVSSPSAVGLIIAQGNVGRSLRSGIGLFFSRDEGITWQKVLDGRYDFAIGDHGGIVVAVPMMENTTTVWYSCTEGISWKNVSFGSVGYHVFAVLTEPGDTTRVFDVFGHYSQSKEFQWLVVKLDFGRSSFLDNKCTANNYTLWSPNDERPGTECLMGQKAVFERRKADVCCYNGGNYTREINVTACACAMDDYQCDVGFEPEGLSEACIPTNKKSIIPENCPEGQTYLHSSGYRKVPGDKCRGGVEDRLKPDVKPCPVKAPAGLQIKVASVVSAGEEVDLHLIQLTGSRISAQYSWDFDDGTPAVKVTGFKTAAHQKHTFARHGLYNVSVAAKNKAGEDYARIAVKVIDAVKQIVIEPPHGVVVGQPAVFNVSLSSAHPSSKPEFGFTHFVWRFAHHARPLLRLDRITEYTFSETGSYRVSVEAINAVSRASDSVDVVVYEVLTMVRLVFDNPAGEELTRAVRHWFAQRLQTVIAELLKMRPDRLEVVVLPGLPTNADVSLIANSSDTASTDKAAKSLIDYVHKGLVVVTLPKGVSVKALNAEEIARYVPASSISPPVASPGGTDTRLAIAVGVAAGLLLTFLGLVVLYFYRRYRRLEQRYSRLQQQDHEPLLRNSDDEDEDNVQARAGRPGSIRYAPLREADMHMSETDDELLSDLNTGPLVVMNGERAVAANEENAITT